MFFKNPARACGWGFMRLNCPVSVLEHGDALSVFGYARYRHILTAYHKVNVNHRTVYAEFFTLLDGIVFVIFKTVVEASAERKMTACVFVEQSIIEKYTRVVYRRIVGYKRALAELRGALVHRYHFFKQVLILFGVNLHGFAVFKPYPEIFNKLSLIGKRFGCNYFTFRYAAPGRSENFFAGDIGVIINVTAERILAAAQKDTVGIKPHRKIGAVRTLVFELFELITV